MAEDKLLDDFDNYVSLLLDVKGWLEKLYYDPEFSSVFNRTAISMLITGCQFVITNLNQFRAQWKNRLK